MKATVTTGGMGQRPDNVEYLEVTDQHARAAVVAHMIRIGHRPAVGIEICFSQTVRIAEVDDVVAASGEIDYEKATPVTEKQWVRMNVTQADIAAAHALINEQAAVYREAGGRKVSQVSGDSE